MKNHVILIGFSLLMALASTGVTAERSVQPDTGDQRAECDARCREDYQNNAAAMEACLRDCGAVGPASATAIGHEATHTVQQGGADTAPDASARATTVKSSKSNSQDRATTVKSSKSNSSERGTTVKSGKSNSSDRATTVKGSKSNSDNRQASPETGEAPPEEPTEG